MSKNFVRPKDILNTIKKRDDLNVSTMRTVYNARQRYRTKDLAGRTQMQQLLSKLSEHNYVEHHRSNGPDNVLTDLFWTHPINVDILRSFPHVIILDCTYKTNRYRFPLLEIVGMTSTDITFSVAFAYLEYEKEDNYIWALCRLKELFNDDLPHVFVTDRDLALMKAIHIVFPTSCHMLCTWHINNNVVTNCKKLFDKTEKWEIFSRFWNSLITCPTVKEYNRILQLFESRFSEYPTTLTYLKNTWLVHKEKFVSAWTNTYMHLGNTTSNRAESAHARLKRQLGSSQLNFDLSWDHMHSLIQLQHTDIKASFEKSRCVVQHCSRREELKALRGFVSIAALNKIIQELDSAGFTNENNIASCDCSIRHTHGLPCFHMIASYTRNNEPIPLYCVHPHWRKLDYIITPSISTSKRSNIIHLEPYMIRFQEWCEEQSDEIKKQVLLKIDEIITPSSTTLKEPQVKTNNRGRPRKDDTSTRRDPSAFEYVMASSVHESDFSAHKLGSQLGRKKSKTSSKKQEETNTQESQAPKKRKTKQKMSNKAPSVKYPRLTNEYTSSFPIMYQQYIANQTDVDMDGNCGYRVVAISMGFGHDGWRTVRKHLLDELRGNRHFYENRIFGEEKRVRELETCLDYFGDGFVNEEFWMTLPDMGHLIASCYDVTVIHLSHNMCVTYLPLYRRNANQKEDRGYCEGGEFAIGFVGRHFVKVNLTSGFVPIPPVSPIWHNYQLNNGHLYGTYEARIENFKSLDKMGNVATRDSFLDIVEVD